MRIEIQQGDITQSNADCIVNAANPGLHAGAGVCGAIFAKAGLGLAEWIETHEWHGCHTGSAVITPAFGELYDNGITSIIHAVGPDMRVFTDLEFASELLFRTYQSIFELAEAGLADEHKIKHIAIPAISTGVYGFPIDKAAEIAVSSAAASSLHFDFDISLVAFDEETALILNDKLKVIERMLADV